MSEKSEAAVTIIKDGIENNLKRSQIIESVIEKTGLSRQYVASMYASAAKFSGYTPPSEGISYEEVDEILLQELADAVKPVKMAEVVKILVDRGVRKNPAKAFAKKFAEAHEGLVHKRISIGKDAKDAVVKECLEDGLTRSQTIAYLQDKFGYSEASAAGAYQDSLKRNGWKSNPPPRGLSASRMKVVNWLANHPGSSEDDLIAFMDSENISKTSRVGHIAMLHSAVILHKAWTEASISDMAA